MEIRYEPGETSQWLCVRERVRVQGSEKLCTPYILYPSTSETIPRTLGTQPYSRYQVARPYSRYPAILSVPGSPPYSRDHVPQGKTHVPGTSDTMYFHQKLDKNVE